MFKQLSISVALVLSLNSVARAEDPLANEQVEKQVRILKADAPIYQVGVPVPGTVVINHGFDHPAGTLLTVSVTFVVEQGASAETILAPIDASFSAYTIAQKELLKGRLPTTEPDQFEWDSGVPVGPIFSERQLPSS